MMHPFLLKRVTGGIKEDWQDCHFFMFYVGSTEPAKQDHRSDNQMYTVSDPSNIIHRSSNSNYSHSSFSLL